MPDIILRRYDTRFRLANFSEAAARRFERGLSEVAVSDAMPLVERIRDARVRRAMPKPDGTFHGGVFDASDRPVPAAQTRKASKITLGADFRADDGTVARLPEAIYGGLVFSRYGHLVLETLARLWAIDDLPDVPILFQTTAPPGPASPLFFFLNALGIARDRIVFATGDHRVDTLHVAPPAFVQHESINRPAAARLWGRIGAGHAAAGAGDRVYLSRADLPAIDRKSLDEAVVQSAAADAGYRARSLERASLPEQIAIVNGCSHLMGFIGSQFHNIIFRTPAAPLEIVYLCDELPFWTYPLIDLLFPGERTYAAVESFAPFRKVDTTTPFRSVTDATRATFASLGLTLAAAQPVADADYATAWMRSTVARLDGAHRLDTRRSGSGFAIERSRIRMADAFRGETSAAVRRHREAALAGVSADLDPGLRQLLARHLG